MATASRPSLAIVDPPRDTVSGECSKCSEPVRYCEGPIGWDQSEGGGPLCDSCLFAADEGLGMVLRISNLAIELGRSPGVFSRPGAPAALERFYRDYAERFGPAGAHTRASGLVHFIEIFSDPGLDARATNLFFKVLVAAADVDHGEKDAN